VPWHGEVKVLLGSQIATCRGLELAEGGVRFTGAWWPLVDQSVTVRFELLGTPLVAHGHVSWHRRLDGRSHYAVTFGDVSPEVRAKIRAFLWAPARVANPIPAGPAFADTAPIVLATPGPRLPLRVAVSPDWESHRSWLAPAGTKVA
jgi:hypothetical protein